MRQAELGFLIQVPLDRCQLVRWQRFCYPPGGYTDRNKTYQEENLWIETKQFRKPGLRPRRCIELASGFPVGMGLAGCSCGALTGGVMSLGLKYGRTQAAAPTPGMFEAAKELHDRFLARRKSTCCRVLIRKFQMGSPDHIQQCIAITGEVAADVIDILSRDQQPSIQPNNNGESNG